MAAKPHFSWVCGHFARATTRSSFSPNCAGKLDTLWRIYAKHLKTPEAIEAMDELITIVKSGQSVCLLCYERDKDCCHRTRIAEVVHERTGANVVDLAPQLEPQFPSGARGASCLSHIRRSSRSNSSAIRSSAIRSCGRVAGATA